MRPIKSLLLALPLALAAVPPAAQQAADAVAPEAATDTAFADAGPRVRAALEAKAAGTPVRAQDWMVAAAHPLAVEAGADVLARGGSAADAMVAVQTVLGLVEPQSSGLGGGAFLVWYDAATGEVTTLDGRETAPLSASPTLFQEDGAPMQFFDAVVGGRSVGVPGTPALMKKAHEKWGRVTWAGLFDPAIALAEDGFTVSPRLASLVLSAAPTMADQPATMGYFFPGGAPVRAGDTLTNAPYAATLRTLAAEGIAPFYTGEIAAAIVHAVQTAPGNPGGLEPIDLAIYQVRERPAVCLDYRAHEVCGMGPPSSGGLSVGQILGLIEPYDIAGLGPDSPEAWRLIADASRLTFADRGRYMADSDYVPVPVKGLLADAYLAERAKLLDTDAALPEVAPGRPEFDHAAVDWADDDAIELPSTSHISIVDGFGNALSMTTTIENGFGSRVMAAGFLLNNELTDFSFTSHEDGVPVANRVEPGKRPRSSMAPTIVLKDGKPWLVVGSPGGSRIIGYVAQAVIAAIDWGMDPQQAVSMGHVLNRFGTTDLESGTPMADLAGPLKELGFEVSVQELNSGLHAIALGEGPSGGLRGGADPRREGIALGE